MQTRALFLAALSLALFPRTCRRVAAANFEVTNSVQGIEPAVLAIDAGDTVTWKLNYETNVEDYYGRWSSPPLTNAFSLTFPTPGFYPYLTSDAESLLHDYGGASMGVGVIAVLGWTNHPPVVRINWPVDGFVFGNPQRPIGVVTTIRLATTNIARVELLANSNVVWTATNSPFHLRFQQGTNFFLARGSYSLQVRVTDRSRREYFSTPVSILVGAYYPLSEPRILRDGSFLGYYSTGWGGPDLSIHNSTSFPPPVYQQGSILGLLEGNGVFVDRRALTNRARFYKIGWSGTLLIRAPDRSRGAVPSK